MADHPSESDMIAAWRSIALKYQQLQRLLSAQRAPYSAHVRGGRPYSGPECTQQGAAPIVDPWPVLVHPQVHLTCAHLLHSAPKGRPGNIRDCTHHCTKCPHAPPFSVLLAPSSNQSCHNREQGAFRARRWCRYRCRWERAYRLPITCLTPAQAAPTIETQRLSRVFAWALGGRLVHIYRAWASVGKQAVLRVHYCLLWGSFVLYTDNVACESTRYRLLRCIPHRKHDTRLRLRGLPPCIAHSP